jgi:hypothetical protein
VDGPIESALMTIGVQPRNKKAAAIALRPKTRSRDSRDALRYLLFVVVFARGRRARTMAA